MLQFPKSFAILIAAATGALFLVGCSESQPTGANGAQGSQAAAGAAGGVGATPNANTAGLAIDVAALTNQLAAQFANQFTAAQQSQAELVQKLTERIEQLESRNAQQLASAQTAEKGYQENSAALKQALADLQKKVNDLESGRVLPEIAITGDDGPSTRELDQKIRVVERNSELAAEAAEAKQKEQPHLSLGSNGFAFSSPDTNFVLRVRGLVQLDSRTFFNDSEFLKGNDGFVLRRARPIIEGTVFRDFDYQFVPDFGASTVQIFDANLNYRLRPELQVRAGKFKGPVGLENLQADANLLFNERSFVSALVPNRSLGLQLWGDIGDGALSYAAGIFNASGDGRVAGNFDFGDDREYAARLFAQPFRLTSLTSLYGLGFGVGGSYSDISSNSAALPITTGGTLPGYTTPGAQQFFAYNPIIGSVVADGAQWRISPQAYYYVGPFGLLGEYIVSHQSVLNNTTLRAAGLDHEAWNLSAQWVLTGEAASFNGITPLHPFSLGGGGWGAWQLAARYGHLNIDKGAFEGFSNPDASASSADSWSVGLNWWLNKNIRVLTSYSHTTFEGGGKVNPAIPGTTVPPSTVAANDEDVFLTRLQLSF